MLVRLSVRLWCGSVIVGAVGRIVDIGVMVMGASCYCRVWW